MRLCHALAAIALSACAQPATGDDTTTPDGGVDPGPGCSDLSPRTVELEAFVAPVGYQNRVDAFIDGAHDTLDVQMYLFTVTAISDRIVAAKNRGVVVRVLLDPDEAGNANVRSRLTAAAVPTRNAPSIYNFSHAKYLVADGASALIMSANFNADAMTNERNYGILDRDPADLTDLQAIFTMDWAAAGGESVQPADLSCTRLVVSPNNAKQRILDHVNSAQSTLEIEAMYVTDTGVQDAVVAAKARGVEIRVILEGSMDNQTAIALFHSKGITVHNSVGFYLHAKLVIADGVSFIGSENFSVTSLTKNREVGVLLFEESQRAIPRDQFEADWSSTPVAP